MNAARLDEVESVLADFYGDVGFSPIAYTIEKMTLEQLAELSSDAGISMQELSEYPQACYRRNEELGILGPSFIVKPVKKRRP